MNEFIKTFSELSRLAETSCKTAQKWMSGDGAPMRLPQGWPTVETLAFCKRMKGQANLAQTASNAELKAVKLSREIALLDERIAGAKIDVETARREADIRRGELITRAEHNDQLLKFAAIVKRTLEQLPMSVAAMCSNSELLRPMQEKIDSVLTIMSKECEKAGI